MSQIPPDAPTITQLVVKKIEDVILLTILPSSSSFYGSFPDTDGFAVRRSIAFRLVTRGRPESQLSDRVLPGLLRPAERSLPLHHQTSTCLHTTDITISFHMSIPAQAASSYHILHREGGREGGKEGREGGSRGGGKKDGHNFKRWQLWSGSIWHGVSA